jgi:hypothetical protein
MRPTTLLTLAAILAGALLLPDAAPPAAAQSRNSPIDLVQTTLIVPGKITIGTTFRLTDEIESVGDAPAGQTMTYFYLSKDDKLDEGDLLVAKRLVPPLGPGQTLRDFTRVTLPDTVEPGTYFMIAKANANGAIEERYIDNNTKATKCTVIAASDKK